MKLGTAYVVVKTDQSGLPRELKAANKHVEGAVFSMNQTIKDVNWKSVGLGLAAVSGAAALAFSKVLDIAVKVDAMHKSMAAATGSTMAAKSAFKFLREESERLGLVFEDQIKGFKGLAAASKGTALEGESIRKIYIGIATAATSLQMSQEEVGGALNAVSQMISKGTVQAEELRGQLGERLPGAFQIAARAMGVTTQELGKMLEQGQVIAEDFLPKFADELMKTFKDSAKDGAKSAGAEVNRLKNSMFDLQAEMAKGIIPTMAKFLKSVNLVFFPNEKTKVAMAVVEVRKETKKFQKDLEHFEKRAPAIIGYGSIAGMKRLKASIKENDEELACLIDTYRVLSGGSPVGVGIEEVKKKTDELTDAINIQGVDVKTLDKLRETAAEQDKTRIQEAIDEMGRQVAAKEKADADMLASFKQMADDELVMWDALNAAVLADLDKFDADYIAKEKKRVVDLGLVADDEVAAFAGMEAAILEGQVLFEADRVLKNTTTLGHIKKALEDSTGVGGAWPTWGGAVVTITQGMYGIVEGGLSDAFVAMATDMGDMESVWETFTGNILKMFADMLAQMAVQWAASAIINTLSSGSLTLAAGTAPSIVSTGLSVAGIGTKLGGLFGGGSVGGIPAAGVGLGAFEGAGAVTAGTGMTGLGMGMLGPAALMLALPALGMYLGMKKNRGRPMTEAERYQAEISNFVQRISNEVIGPSGGGMLSSEDLGARLRGSGLDDEQRFQAAKRVSIGNLVNIEGSLIADESTFNDFVDQIDLRLYQIGQLETGT